MSSGRHSLMVMGALAASLTLGAAVAEEMSEEDQAILDQMAQMEAAQAQMRVAQQFGDVVRYSVVGSYQAQTNVSADANWIAYADVTDRVELQLQWQLSEGKMIGAPSIQNHKATLANPRNWEKKCAPPKIEGPFEFELKKVEAGLGGTMRLHMQTNFPPVQVHQMCTGALKPVAAKQTPGMVELFVPPPTMLAMPLPANGDVTRSADGKSLVHKKGGWTWTFTPRGQQ